MTRLAQTTWPPRRSTFGRSTPTKPNQAAWNEGKVDVSAEHIGIHFGEGKKPVALVGHSRRSGFTVQFLIKESTGTRSVEILNQIRQELNFYLLHAVGPNSWDFAKYHCETVANARSRIHWRLCGSPDEAES